MCTAFTRMTELGTRRDDTTWEAEADVTRVDDAVTGTFKSNATIDPDPEPDAKPLTLAISAADVVDGRALGRPMLARLSAVGWAYTGWAVSLSADKSEDAIRLGAAFDAVEAVSKLVESPGEAALMSKGKASSDGDSDVVVGSPNAPGAAGSAVGADAEVSSALRGPIEACTPLAMTCTGNSSDGCISGVVGSGVDAPLPKLPASEPDGT